MTASLGEALKTALARKWAEDDEAHSKMESTPAPVQQEKKGKRLFQPTNNLTRSTFEQIRSNPAPRSEITRRLTARGYNANSVSSIITQMIRQGSVVIDPVGFLRATVSEYQPLRPWKHKEKIVIKKKEAKRPVSSSSAGLAAIAPTQKQSMVPTVITNEIEHILNTLPIKQAHALYVELHKIFGDLK